MAKKLTPSDIEQFQRMLLQIRAEITGDINHLEQDAFGINGEKASVDIQADSGSDSYYQEFNLELLERDESSLRRLDEALQRVADGTFGRCEECDAWIPKTRLRTIPYARFCIDCQRKNERES